MGSFFERLLVRGCHATIRWAVEIRAGRSVVSEKHVIAWLAAQDTATYLVGGCVRDRVLERLVYDLDVATPGDPLCFARRLADDLGGKYYPLDKERGTGRAILNVESEEPLVVDITRLRGDLAADLATRDFTVNALASDIRTPDEIIDLHGGLSDLAMRLLRPVSDSSIRDDPLRALRAVRLAAELDFSVAPETEALIQRDGRGVTLVSSERVRDELARILARPNAGQYVAQLDDLQLLTVVLPELEPLRGLAQPLPHFLDALAHSIESLRKAESLLLSVKGRFQAGMQHSSRGLDITCTELRARSSDERAAGALAELLFANRTRLCAHFGRVISGPRTRLVTYKLAVLLHDTGKPASVTVEDDGRIRFFGHQETGARAVEAALARLRLSRAEIRLGETIVRHHMRPLMLAGEAKVSSRSVYRFFRDTGDAGIDVLLLALADHEATFTPGAADEQRPRLEALAARMLADYWERYPECVSPRMLLDGRDLMRELELEPGPQVGWLLEMVKEAQASGEVRTRDEALDLARTKVRT